MKSKVTVWLVSAAFVVVVLAIVFRVSALRNFVTGTPSAS